MSVTFQSPDTSNALIPQLYPRGSPRTVGGIEAFGISALAPAIAVIFTNPFDTIKVRLQLQGESQRKLPPEAAKAARIYKSSFDALYKIAKNEGIKGLQKGLTPAILREGSKNLFRIGMYDPIMSLIHDTSQGSAPGWKRALAGSICGVMGAVSCNPFELVKTRLQSASSKTPNVGHQHGYTGVWNALSTIVKQDGFKGLYRGSLLSMSRSILGSGSNLATYSLLKEYLIVEKGWADNVTLDMVAGLASGAISCVFMNPVDVTRTRYYNQKYVNGKGVTYSSGLDAALNIFKTEGPFAFYRGFLTHFLRIGPHFCLTFVFLGMLRRNLAELYVHLDLKDSFGYYDADKNGSLSREEIDSMLKSILPRPSVQLAPPEYDRVIASYTSRLLAKADINHDGRIDFEEYPVMEAEIRAIYRERATAFLTVH